MSSVSIITPTYDREKFHARIMSCVRNQTYRNIEWIVLDDSPRPSRLLAAADPGLVRYVHVPDRLTTGQKRNVLAEMAQGDIIVHFDDDDYYAPGYVGAMVHWFATHPVDFINLRGWFMHDTRHGFFGYWNLMIKTGLHFVCADTGVSATNVEDEDTFANNELGWGFGYAYRRKVTQAIRYPEINWNNDCTFAQEVQRRFAMGHIMDVSGICLHEMHGANASRAFAQSNIPIFMLEKVFPGYTAVD